MMQTIERKTMAPKDIGEESKHKSELRHMTATQLRRQLEDCYYFMDEISDEAEEYERELKRRGLKI